MNKRVMVWGAAALLIGAGAGMLQAQTDKKKAGAGGHAKRVIFAQADKATYKPGPSEKVSMATIWGDPEKGAHATFTKFEPGYDAGMHTHTNDVWMVVIKGAYLYKDEAGEKRVAVGDFLRVPGGHKHWSGGDKSEGAVFYEEGSGKFDLVPAQ
jgi:quercetin dioxygenase-like cupin family protein